MRKAVGFALGILIMAGRAVALAADSGGQVAPAAPSAPIPPAEAPRHMTLPDGFTATLFAGEPDVVQPIAMTFDDRGRLWVAECLSYPNWNTDATADAKGKDRIVVFEDTDNDGHFDKRTVFADDLVNLSGLELGFGGVYACSMPFLKFIPADFNADDPKPAGPAKVLLDGWNTKQAGHNVVNGLTWGPDGWLYGLNGIQSKSAVGKPGTPDAQRAKFDCAVWRYHPTRQTFEVVCWGTTNPFGLDFDEYGQGFITNCVIKHLWHVIPGAHYQRMYGEDYNRNTYDLMESSADHVHFVGSWTDVRSGPNKNLDAGGGHAHVGAMVYLGDNWPDAYRNGLFTVNLHGNRVNQDILERTGSGYVAHHGKDFLLANDSWFRGIAIKYGPDGGVYVSDWTDTGECHNAKVVDRDNGRIHKVVYGKPTPFRGDVSKLGDEELAQLQLHKNEWLARQARRVLQERAAGGKLKESVATTLGQVLTNDPNVPHRLRALWALNAVEGANDGRLTALLAQSDPYVRSWAIRLALDDKDHPSESIVGKLAELAHSDPSPVVRLAIASALQRLPVEKVWDIAAGLLAHAEDGSDQNLPLMYWYGVEPLAGADPARALDLLTKAKLPLVRGFIARRAAGTGEPERLDLLVDLLARTDDTDIRRDVLRGVNQALAGQRRVTMPKAWPEAYAKLHTVSAGDVRDAAMALALTFGDPQAFDALHKVAAEHAADPKARSAALQALVNAKDPQLLPLLNGLLADPALRSGALRGLAAANDESSPQLILKHYPQLTPVEKQDAIQTLASRPTFAMALLDAVGAGTIAKADLSAATVRQLANSDKAEVKQKLEKVWGVVRPPAKDKAPLIAKYKSQFTPEVLKRADVSHGRVVFTNTCAQCHILFDAGGKVGPNLTGSQRANLDYLLENVVDPSAAVAREYQMTIVDTTDGRTINGVVVAENDKGVTIRTTNEDVIVPKDEIAKRRVSPYSMMPEGLLEGLKPEDARDLIGYLSLQQPPGR